MSADRWVLVPVKPTPEMIEAGEPVCGLVGATMCYSAMLAAAPAAPAAEPDGWEANAAYLLDRCPFTVRQRPGGGPEDLLSSMVVTFMGMQQRLTASGAAPAQSREPLTDERLTTFLNAAAGEGLVLDGVDAADLYIALFPERYRATIDSIAQGSQP